MTFSSALRQHWPEYLMEAWALGMFMISAALLLRSANERHPHGLANISSGLVGRNLMKHVLGSLVAVTNAKINPSKFQKTMAINDFYWGEPGYEFPMGNIQLMGKTVMDGLIGQEAKYAPMTLEAVANCSVDWWLTSEDVPLAKNRVAVDGERIIIDYGVTNNAEPFARLNERWKGILQEIDRADNPRATLGYFTTKMPMHSMGHQVGTCKFCEAPRTSDKQVDQSLLTSAATERFPPCRTSASTRTGRWEKAKSSMAASPVPGMATSICRTPERRRHRSPRRCRRSTCACSMAACSCIRNRIRRACARSRRHRPNGRRPRSCAAVRVEGR